MVFVGFFLQIFILWVFFWVFDYQYVFFILNFLEFLLIFINSDVCGEIVIVGMFCYLFGYVLNCIFIDYFRFQGVCYFGVVWIQIFGIFSYFFNIVWMLFICEDFEVCVLVMVMVIMGVNIVGIYGV